MPAITFADVVAFLFRLCLFIFSLFLYRPFQAGLRCARWHIHSDKNIEHYRRHSVNACDNAASRRVATHHAQVTRNRR